MSHTICDENNIYRKQRPIVSSKFTFTLVRYDYTWVNVETGSRIPKWRRPFSKPEVHCVSKNVVSNFCNNFIKC